MCRKELSGGMLLFVSLALVALSFRTCEAVASSPDMHALQEFQASVDANFTALNWRAGDPCTSHWSGVRCDSGGYVRELVLEGLQLSGPVDALASLTQLRLLSLKDNRLNGTLPNMTQWRFMRHLYLHDNQFSGAIPDSISALSRLLRFTAFSNQLSGAIPLAMTSLTHLYTLRLENNQLTGSIPQLEMTNLTDFNVSHNHLVGQIPSSLNKFGASAFQGNPLLCGQPVFTGALCTGSVPMTVPSTESPRPGSISEKKKSGRLSTGSIIAIVLGDAAALLLITFAFLLYYWRKYPSRQPNAEKATKKMGGKNISLSQYTPMKASDSDRSKLVFFEGSGKHLFELDDLLRASAEMLGKGSFGTAYKAVLEDGTVVAVKRLKEVSTSSKKDFDQKMELVGQMRHPNVLPLLAYYYAKEEKLLVYNLQPNGSLYALLHGLTSLLSISRLLTMYKLCFTSTSTT